MEFLSNIGIWIVSALGGISLAGIIAAIIYGCLKGGFDKAIRKINFEKMSENLANKQAERIKKVSFTHSIQPIVMSELKKITETANEYIKAELEAMQKRYDNLLIVLEKFYAYFDDSLISEAKKEELREALNNAKIETTGTEYVESSEVVIDEPKQAPKTENPSTTNIER